MIRPKLVVVNNDRDEQSRANRDGKGLRFELSRIRAVVYGLSLVLSLCFMFTLGIFVGRGASVIRADDVSVKGRFLRLFGLENQIGAAAPKASVTWEDPKKMIESLDYYQDLTRKKGSPLAMLQRETQNPPPASPAGALKQAKPEVKAAKQAKPEAGAAKKDKPAAVLKKPAGQLAASPPAGRYTLLVASLKERDAQKLLDKLKGDGYSPFVESIEFGSARWNRILLGSFSTREAAISFADQFNKKENTEALVINGAK